jgi:hypothetical protein
MLLLFFINSNIIFSQNNAVQALLDSLSIENIKTHIDSLCWAGGYETRSTFTAGNSEAAHYIYNYLSYLPGLTEVKLDTFYIRNSLYPYSTYPQYNVVATIEGKSDSPDIILLGGHYDTSGSRGNGYDDNWNSTFKARGADDNATGTASVMEIARVLSESTDTFDNKHTFKFVAFGAEEYHPVHPNAHHVGSLFDAENMYNANEPLTAVIILDMIGYNNNYNYTEVISNQASLWLADQVYAYRYIYVPDLHTNSTPVDVPYSDHESYQDYGFSAILLMENDRPWNDDSPYYRMNPYYHTSNDVQSTLNYDLIEMVAQLALVSSASLSLKDDPTSVENNQLQSDNLPESFQLSAYPNPFNGLVNIQFTIPEANEIDISIYNSLGQKIQSLYSDEEFSAGIHNVRWDAGSNPSGIYYCVLNNTYGTKYLKLMILK